MTHHLWPRSGSLHRCHSTRKLNSRLVRVWNAVWKSCRKNISSYQECGHTMARSFIYYRGAVKAKA